MHADGNGGPAAIARGVLKVRDVPDDTAGKYDDKGAGDPSITRAGLVTVLHANGTNSGDEGDGSRCFIRHFSLLRSSILARRARCAARVGVQWQNEPEA